METTLSFGVYEQNILELWQVSTLDRLYLRQVFANLDKILL